MSRFTNGAILLIVASVTLPASAQAQGTGAVPSQWFVPDARAQGQGRAYTAIAEGPSAAWWNPGALPMQHLSFSPYSELQVIPEFDRDVWIKHLSASGSWRRVGLGFQRTRLDYGPATDETGRETVDAYETVTLLGCGFDLTPSLCSPDTRNRIGIGANLKLFHSTAGVFRSREITGDAWDLDMGALAVFRWKIGLGGGPAFRRDPSHASFIGLRTGLVFKNALGREIDFEPFGGSDPLGPTLRAGIAGEARLIPVPPLGHLLQATISADYDESLLHADEDPIFFYGAEVGLVGIFFIRHGYIFDAAGEVRDWTNGWGAGIDIEGLGGLRYDKARYPKARDLRYNEQDSFSIWFDLRRVLQ